jgi:GntR family transcriptional regulator
MQSGCPIKAPEAAREIRTPCQSFPEAAALTVDAGAEWGVKVDIHRSNKMVTTTELNVYIFVVFRQGRPSVVADNRRTREKDRCTLNRKSFKPISTVYTRYHEAEMDMPASSYSSQKSHGPKATASKERTPPKELHEAGKESPVRKATNGPLYRWVYSELRSELARGTWKPGELLPTESELSDRFGVSPGTVKQAVLGLAREGLVVRRAGRGTFVSRLDGSRSFARFFQFRHGSSGKQLEPMIKVIEVGRRTSVPDQARHHLDLRPGREALRVRRLLVQEDVPICIYDSFMVYRMVRGLENVRLDVDRLYRAIEKKLDLHVVSVTEKLRADVVNNSDAKLLEILPGSPIIEIERVAYTHNNKVLEWRHTIGRSDHFVYTIHLP